jgi:murein DD-endopeptidase MepM/ murein hydrolase activator NlpD
MAASFGALRPPSNESPTLAENLTSGRPCRKGPRVARSLALPLLCAGALAGLGPGPAGHAQAPAALRAQDYSRFSDGPRRVPRPRGASLERATALGIGTHEAAKRLLREPPEPRWVRAARGQVPASLHWPVDGGRFGRGFGFVRDSRPDLRHNGIDVAAPTEAVVRAVADGIVAYSDNGVRGFGNCVLIIHPNGWVSVYAHNYRNTVQAGWRVTRGERIAFVGQTGIARGPHLHFELRVDGRPVDPVPLFRQIPSKGDRFHDPDPRPAAARPAPSVAAASETAAPAANAAMEPFVAPALPHPAGTVELAHQLLRHPADPALLEALDLRLFGNVLWPVKGGRLASGAGGSETPDLRIEADPDSGIRAAADGLVLFAGDGLDGAGAAVVLLHRNGWVTAYRTTGEIHATPGERVLRGQWIARVGEAGDLGAPSMRFELRDAGAPRDPGPLLVQVPTDGDAP